MELVKLERTQFQCWNRYDKGVDGGGGDNCFANVVCLSMYTVALG